MYWYDVIGTCLRHAQPMDGYPRQTSPRLPTLSTIRTTLTSKNKMEKNDNMANNSINTKNNNSIFNHLLKCLILSHYQHATRCKLNSPHHKTESYSPTSTEPVPATFIRILLFYYYIFFHYFFIFLHMACSL